VIDIWSAFIAKAAEVYEPNDAVGLVGLLIIGLPTTITAVGTVFVLVRQHKTKGQVETLQQHVADVQQGVATVQQGVVETKNQVVNGHPQPLRVDLDRQFADVIENVQALHNEVGGLRHEVGGMRTDIAVEQGARREANRAIGARLDSIEEHLRSK